MRPLRWKSRYLTGNDETDLNNRDFVDCLNKLVHAARTHEHCHDVEEVLENITDEADRLLLEQSPDIDLTERMRGELLQHLPLPSYGTNACRKCGVCEIAARKVADRFEEAALCLHLEEAPEESQTQV